VKDDSLIVDEEFLYVLNKKKKHVTLSLQQAVEAHRVVRHRSSHVFIIFFIIY
jgi:hypothetical protein